MQINSGYLIYSKHMDYKPQLLKYLTSFDLMSLATQGSTVTNCIVYYAIDDELNFYIVTSPNSEHGKNFRENDLVACAIADTSQQLFKTKHKVGVQMKGVIRQITDKSKMKKALVVWTKDDNKKIEEFYTNISQGIWSSQVYIISPVEIKWFNEKLFGKDGTRLFKF